MNRFSLVGVLWLFTAPLSATELAEIQVAVKSVQSIQADFVQTKTVRLLKAPLESKGTFVFQSPDWMRWEYVSPVRSLMLTGPAGVEKFVWSQGKPVKDASANVEAMRIVMQKLVGWLSGRLQEDASFSVQLLPGTPVVIELSPKESSIARFIQKVRLTFAQDLRVVQSVEIVEAQAASTLIRFERIVLDKPLEPSWFASPK